METNYDNARSSKYGKEISFLLETEIPFTPTQVTMKAISSTFSMSEELAEEVRRKWEEKGWGPDGMKWRYEGYKISQDNGLELFVSPIMYSWHNILRDKKGMPYDFYPTPLTVNSIQETLDEKIAIAVRGKKSDQRGLCFLGSGFIDRLAGDAIGTSLLYTPFDAANQECSEETSYDVPVAESGFDIQNATMLGLVRGSNTDVATIIHVPLNVSSDKVHLRAENGEHDDLFFLSTDESSLINFLEKKGVENARAADHLLGGIELYLIHRYHKNTLK